MELSVENLVKRWEFHTITFHNRMVINTRSQRETTPLPETNIMTAYITK
jgi:hypothetical protein